MAKKKKTQESAEAANISTSTTAIIPRALQREVQSRIKPLKISQVAAINDGLKLWLVYQYADEEMAKQLREAVKRVDSKLKKIEEEIIEEAAKQSSRRSLTG